ncbi:MAG: glycosyltransferase [Lachnospiraceae bacterium]
MSGVKHFGIMVIYNKSLLDSITYQCLKDADITLVVCDNSEKTGDNVSIAGKDGVEYLPMGGNRGLSYAYNRALEYIFSSLYAEDGDVISLFDDDTQVSVEYLEKARSMQGQIALPVMRDTLGIMSPVLMEGCYVRRIESTEQLMRLNPRKLSGINSAMALRAGIMRNYRYCEEMFLDYIDHMFIMDMRKKNIFPEVMQVELHQKFSAVEDSAEAARARFALQKRDLKIFYKNSMFLYYIVVLKKHFKLVMKYKDLRMLFC